MLGPKNVEQSRITFSMEKNGLICNSLKLHHKFCMKLETKSFTVINANITKKAALVTKTRVDTRLPKSGVGGQGQ